MFLQSDCKSDVGMSPKNVCSVTVVDWTESCRILMAMVSTANQVQLQVLT